MTTELFEYIKNHTYTENLVCSTYNLFKEYNNNGDLLTSFTIQSYANNFNLDFYHLCPFNENITNTYHIIKINRVNAYCGYCIYTPTLEIYLILFYFNKNRYELAIHHFVSTKLLNFYDYYNEEHCVDFDLFRLHCQHNLSFTFKDVKLMKEDINEKMIILNKIIEPNFLLYKINNG